MQAEKEKGRRSRRPSSPNRLQRGLDLESPSLEQGLRNVLGILIPARPFTQTRGALVLLGLALDLLHCLLEGGHDRVHRVDRLGLSPVRISATLCHDLLSSCLYGLLP